MRVWESGHRLEVVKEDGAIIYIYVVCNRRVFALIG